MLESRNKVLAEHTATLGDVADVSPRAFSWNLFKACIPKKRAHLDDEETDVPANDAVGRRAQV